MTQRKRSSLRTLGGMPLLVCACFLLSSCMAGGPIQTKAYDWRPFMYPKEPKQRDWFELPSQEPKQKIFEAEYGLCATPPMRPYLQELKKLTKKCVQVSHTFHSAASTSRLSYILLVTIGAIGGAAVLAGPILSTLKLEVQNIDAGLLLTVGGAALTATAVLWLQLGDVGNLSNQAFRTNANLVRLIQHAESHWNVRVCHAKSEAIAKNNATKILAQMAQQCVKDVPGVTVNPNIAGAVRKQQGEVSSIIANYQVLRNHMDDQLQVSTSKKELESLVRQIHEAQDQLSKTQYDSESFLRLHAKLKSLCAQATSEHLRLQMLRGRAQKKEPTANSSLDQEPMGGWSGLCQRMPDSSQIQLKLMFQRSYSESMKKKQKLVQQIQLLHQKVAQQGKPTPSQLQALKGLCLQAVSEHQKASSLLREMFANKLSQGVLLPGGWLGLCKLYAPNLTRPAMFRPHALQRDSATTRPIQP